MARQTDLGDDGHVGIKQAAEAALCGRLVALGVELDADGRAEHLREVVVPTIDDASLGQAVADLREGSGGELTSTSARRPKFHSAYSSSALAVNTFGPWRLEPRSLNLNEASEFTTLRFEVKQPIFTRSATPPNLDVLIEGSDGVVGIESKLTEYLAGSEVASFSDRYDDVVSELAEESWATMYSLLKDEPRRFRYLNADQLVKHYLGLKSAKRAQAESATLIYAYWEPTDADSYDIFAHHQKEAADFAAAVSDPMIRFASMSYATLWRDWDTHAEYQRHVAALRNRYDVPLHL